MGVVDWLKFGKRIALDHMMLEVPCTCASREFVFAACKILRRTVKSETSGTCFPTSSERAFLEAP